MCLQDDTAFIDGVRDIIRNDCHTISNYNYSSDNAKSWYPPAEKMESKNLSRRRILARYFRSVLPGLQNSGAIHDTYSVKKYGLFSPVFKEKRKQKKHKKKNQILPPISAQFKSHMETHENNLMEHYQKLPKIEDSKISFSTFKIPIRGQTRTSGRFEFPALGTNRTNKTLPVNTNSKAYNKYQLSSSSLKHVDVKFLPTINSKKSAKPATLDQQISTNAFPEAGFLPALEPKFAYRANALSAFKKPVDTSTTPVITKDKEVSRKRNISIYGSSLPYNFSGASSNDSCDFNILDLEAHLLFSDHGGVDSRGDSVNYNNLLIDSGLDSFDDAKDEGLKENQKEDLLSLCEQLVTVLPIINVTSPFKEDFPDLNSDFHEITDTTHPIETSKSDGLNQDTIIGDKAAEVFKPPPKGILLIPPLNLVSSLDVETKCESIDSECVSDLPTRGDSDNNDNNSDSTTVDFTNYSSPRDTEKETEDHMNIDGGQISKENVLVTEAIEREKGMEFNL
jgi:hypothetical protein